MNVFCGHGHLGQDPVIRQTANAKVANLSLAITNYKKGGQKTTTWLDVVAWGKNANFAESHLKKGSQVAITGRLEEQQYQNQAGQQVRKIKVIASEVVSFTQPHQQQRPQPQIQNYQQQSPQPHPQMDMNIDDQITF